MRRQVQQRLWGSLYKEIEVQTMSLKRILEVVDRSNEIDTVDLPIRQVLEYLTMEKVL